jgi:hypothetical protein
LMMKYTDTQNGDSIKLLIVFKIKESRGKMFQNTFTRSPTKIRPVTYINETLLLFF